nr:hypothetical protein GCM10025732_36400 [Glycomyces mayteni]
MAAHFGEGRERQSRARPAEDQGGVLDEEGVLGEHGRGPGAGHDLRQVRQVRADGERGDGERAGARPIAERRSLAVGLFRSRCR